MLDKASEAIEKTKRILNQETQVELTEGRIGKPLFLLALPVIITNLLQTAYNLIDTFWLGRVSTEALAAVSFAFPVIFLLVSLGIGLSIAGSIMVAQKEGAEDHKEAEKAASQTIMYISVFSIIMGVIGYFAAESVVTFLGAEPDVIPLATDYLEIISLGMIMTFGYSVFSSLMRGYGDTITPMLIMGGSVILNIILDPLLIFGWSIFPELGVEGAAIATVISRGIGFLVGLYILFTGMKGLQISWSQMWPDLNYFKDTLRLGVPASMELVSRSLSVNAILVIVGMFATPVVAAYGVVVRIYSAVYLPAIAVSRSVETMTGQNIGAGKPERADKANDLAAKYMFAILTMFGVFCILLSSQIMGVFAEDQEVISVGSQFLTILGASFGFIGITRAYTGGLRGAGKTASAAVITILSLWAVRIPFAYFSVDFLEVSGIWWAFAISNFAGAFLAYAWFKTGNWKD